MSVEKIFVIDILVRNLDKVLRFYRNNPIGLEVSDVFEDPEWKMRIARVPVGSTLLTFMQPLDPESPLAKRLESRGEGIDHVTFLVGNMNEVVMKLKEFGALIVDPELRENPINEAKHGIEGAKLVGLDPTITKLQCNLIAFECPKCGNGFSPGVNFCSNCGEKIKSNDVQQLEPNAKLFIRNIYKIDSKTSPTVHNQIQIKDIFGHGVQISDRITKNLSFAVQIIEPKGKTNPHSHKDKEQIYFIYKGSGTVVVDEAKARVKEGDVIYIPIAKTHGYYNDTEEPCTLFLIEAKD